MIKTSRLDVEKRSLLPVSTAPSAVPFRFRIGERSFQGFPDDRHTTVSTRLIDACISETIITAHTNDGLTLRAECTQYRDYPVVEWVMFIDCDETGTEDSPIISDWQFDWRIPDGPAVLYHGNGDTVTPDGYEWWKDPVTGEGCHLQPCGDGTPCNGAFPYMRFLLPDGGINVAVGWSGTWFLDAKAEKSGKDGSIREAGTELHDGGEDGIRITAGQAGFRSYLKPGETVRSPRLTLEAYAGSEDRGRNLWRAFYIHHWLPRENGQPLSPKLILHTWKIGGQPEFCGATEENQIKAIDRYLQGGIRPDIWWLDAGWYPCDNDWSKTGTWIPHPTHFPHGLKPVGEKCREEGIDFLVWFEPERVAVGSDLWENHPEDLLFDREADEQDWLGRNALLNIGDKAVCDRLIDAVDAFIKENGIRIYRQDFNIAPAPFWASNTEKDRDGFLENRHIQGYYRFWDALTERNPGLLMDSCASGGRRNDPETMRRSVPFHYTDVGYGDHYVKQKQHREMFEWIPYFRAHNFNWDDENGNYNGQPHGIDEFGYQNALAPALTTMIEWDDPDEIYAIGRRFHPVFRHAARLMLTCDYYPLTECRKDTSDWYALQFDGDTEGFIQIIRNNHVKSDSLTLLNLHIDPDKTYTFTDELGKRSFTVTGQTLARDGFHEKLPLRSGVVWFYTKGS